MRGYSTLAHLVVHASYPAGANVVEVDDAFEKFVPAVQILQLFKDHVQHSRVVETSAIVEAWCVDKIGPSKIQLYFVEADVRGAYRTLSVLPSFSKGTTRTRF